MKRIALALLLSLSAPAAWAQTQCVVPAGAPATPVVSAALEGSHVLKASPGCLLSAYIYNANAAGFFMIFNSKTLPSNGAVTPLECVPVAAANYQFINLAPLPPEYYSTGITAALSTGANCLTLTVATGAFFHALVQ